MLKKVGTSGTSGTKFYKALYTNGLERSQNWGHPKNEWGHLRKNGDKSNKSFIYCRLGGKK